MIEAREIHPVTFFAKDEHHKAITKDFRPRAIVNEEEVKEEDKDPEEEDLSEDTEDLSEDDLPQPSQARLPAKD